MKTVRIAAAQTIEFREDVDGAVNTLLAIAAQAETEKVSLLCFSECFLQGYLTDDRLARRNALDLGSAKFQAILDRLPKTGPMIVLGVIEIEEGRLFNTAVVVERGVLLGRYRKAHLLQGERMFEAGNSNSIFEVDGLKFGINICYDMNFPEAAREISELGASLIVCPSNNMMGREKAEIFKALHNSIRGERCRETGLWLISSDVTGERDGRVAYGPTAVLNPAGEVVLQLPLGQPGLLVFDAPCAA